MVSSNNNVTSLILRRLDYCNCVLYGLPVSRLALLLKPDHQAHITPALQSSLAACQCIWLKIANVSYHTHLTPSIGMIHVEFLEKLCGSWK